MRGILAVVGPTASGKTALSLSLAEHLGAEIISADSMQLYRGMDIGTAKATKEEQERVPHHMIDLISPSETYSTEQYRRDVTPIIDEIKSRGKSVIITGGTGLYLDTLMRKEAEGVPRADVEYREKVLSDIKTQTDVRALWERLNVIDPESAASIHENNVRRVVRALEIYEKTGKPKSYFDRLTKEAEPPFDILVICLAYHNRETLYERINSRVDKMIEQGLISEVRSLYTSGELRSDTTAAQAIGYKELTAYLQGTMTLDEAVELIKLSSRRYAKRQLTWFSHVNCELLYADYDDGVLKSSDELFDEAIEILKNKKYI